MATKFVLIGSGLAGGLLAAYLGRRGYDVDLYERRADPREGNIVGGRSINLALSTRGIYALEQLGIADEVLRHAIPMRGRMIHDKSGALHFSPYDRDPNKFINSIGRAALNTTVIEAAQRYQNVRVHFNHRCIDVDFDSATANLVPSGVEAAVSAANSDHQIIRAQGDAVIGVDGAFSAVRQSMQKEIAGFEYDESYLAHGYKELTIPPTPDGSWRMEKEALHIWPRKSFMMIALPNPDGSFTCTLFWEFEGPRSFATTKTDDEIRRFFAAEFPDAVPLMPSLLDDFKTNPTGSLVTIRCAPWFYKNKVALIGDAAHAVVPFYGQGMNAAFEDCVVLDECLAEFPEDRQRGFAEYFARRKKNADALADLAVQNFIEMRDKTASQTFRAKKKLDHLLEGLLPGIYLPLYTMVTFTRIPYSTAARRACLQNRIVYAGLMVLLLVTGFAVIRLISP
ncbi:MAG: kynurenine 3-monooxygenase [Verrucomicrobia bacterium]|jgi:kynurenine 3-monooxygenase|nr:MAG: kynurenine 3-monooxygenase [Verrucomicrobiota bacterium]PYL79017.1 MAG: kynurenine 3-monooxygenase [Verrucomicrobiota bacterium]PYM05880.1 MAG: kynurenine 3-monooxygenase [Verrucomicrobiota bacterium]